MKVTQVDTLALGHKEVHIFDYIDPLGNKKRILIDTNQIIGYYKHIGLDVDASNVNEKINEIVSSLDNATAFLNSYLAYEKIRDNKQ